MQGEKEKEESRRMMACFVCTTDHIIHSFHHPTPFSSISLVHSFHVIKPLINSRLYGMKFKSDPNPLIVVIARQPKWMMDTRMGC